MEKLSKKELDRLKETVVIVSNRKALKELLLEAISELTEIKKLKIVKK